MAIVTPEAVRASTPQQLVTTDELFLIRQLCLPYKIVAQNMGLDSAALRMRITRLAVKLGVENRTALVVKALKMGLITLNQLILREYGSAKNLSGKNS